MDLTTLIKNTKAYSPSYMDECDYGQQDQLNGSSVLVVKLTNGFSIAYEKGREQLARIGPGGRPQYIDGSETVSVKYHILSPASGRISSGDNARSLETGLADSFSPWGEGKINSYATEERMPLDNLKNDVVDTYKKIIEPLEIVEKKRRSWGVISLVLGGTVAWPITAPLALLGSLLGSRSEVLGFVIYAPGLIPEMAKELVKPSVSYNKVVQKEIIHPEPGEDRAAVFFGGYRGSGENNPHDFKGLPDLLFSDGMWVNGYGGDSNKRTKEDDKQKYQESEYFINVDPKLEASIRESVAAEEKLWGDWKMFKPTLEEHRKLLKSIGFI